MRILITGGAGLIGSHTADALLAQGHQVRILDILDDQIHGPGAGFPSYLNPAVECQRGDVRHPSDVSAALQGIDAVYHFAALTGVGQSMYDLRSYVDTNCTGTATLIESIVKSGIQLKRLVIASSRAVYGEGTHACPEHGTQYPEPRFRADMQRGMFDVLCPTCSRPMASQPTAEDRALNPISVYAWTKKQQEDYCRYAAQTFGIPVTVLRYFNVYGSRQSLQNPYTGVVSIFFSRLSSGKAISLYEHGEPERDFVHVSDVAAANVLALTADVSAGMCINVGTGRRDTIRDIAKALAQAAGLPAITEDRGEFRIGDIRSCFADLERANDLLGYQPRMSLVDGMKEFVAWAAGQHADDMYEKTVEELSRYGLFGRTERQP